MIFVIPLEEPKEYKGMEHVQAHRIDTGTDVARSNKRILRNYFKQMGVPSCDIKKVMKEMGFWGKALGR